MDEGWVDYLAPQLYWHSEQQAQAYETLIEWWSEHTSGGRYIFAGNNLAFLGRSPRWNVDESRTQLEMSRARAESGSQGNIWWNIAPLLEDRNNIVEAFRDEFYSRPALSPPLSTASSTPVQPPGVTWTDTTVRLRHQDSAPLKAYTVYRQEGDGWALDRILPGQTESVELEPGCWAIAAATREGGESRGVVVALG